MARDPGSTWKPLPEAGAPDGYTKTQMIYHSTGTRGSAAGNWNYFARGDVQVESTFIVGYSPSDPTLQIMDSTDRADANGRANQRGISVETVGTGDEPFTDWQVTELIRLGRWARETHGILPRIIPAEPEAGFGWHVMFGAPGPWTSVPGKVCPGGRRIGQLKTVIFPAVFAGAAPQEDFMAALSESEQRELLDASRVLMKELRRVTVGVAQPTPTTAAIGDIFHHVRRLNGLVGQLVTQSPDVDEVALARELAPLLTPAVVEVLGQDRGLTQEQVEAAIRRVLGSLDA
jgi:hypothetical protein